MKVLIPAAGMGTRWHPWSRVVPKELLPLGKYPAIHWVLDEVVAAGVNEIGIVISNTKKAIRDYVDDVWNQGNTNAEINWFYQAKPKGVVDALLSAVDWVSRETVAVLYPDEIHPSIGGGLSHLLEARLTNTGCLIGLTAEKQNRRQAEFEVEDRGGNRYAVMGFRQKGSGTAVGYGTGRYILEQGLTAVHRYVSNMDVNISEELEDDNVFKTYWGGENVIGMVLPEPIFDIGTPENWYASLNCLFKPGGEGCDQASICHSSMR